MKSLRSLCLPLFTALLTTAIVTACGGSDKTPSPTYERPDNSACVATRFRQPGAIDLKRLAPDHDFAQPTGITFLPGDDSTFYVTEQRGTIWRVAQAESGFEVTEFVDLRDFYNILFLPEGCHECGLYSLAFHPDFANNGYIYVSFTIDGDADTPLQSRIVRLRSDDGGLTLARTGAEPEALASDTIYAVEQTERIHNNGHLAFGPKDDFLYVSFGDGGPGGDPHNNAQNTDNPFGSLLRLTDSGDPAPGNEVDTGLPELFAYGFRNPWRWSFDRETGELWVGDVGQASNEEINRVRNGGNYGWRCFEGKEPFGNCAENDDFIEPVFDFQHVDGQSVTGGYVYRGQQMPDMEGDYIFGDFGSGMIWSLNTEGDEYQRTQLLSSGKAISAFGEDHQGELYVLDYAGGGIYQVVPETGNRDLEPVPTQLSETGCVDPNAPAQPAEGLIPYDINEPFWSDNAQKERFLALPNEAQIDVEENGNFALPVGTVLVKNFRLHNALIETRLLLHQPDTGWVGYSYQWNQAQTDATLLEGSLRQPMGDQDWHYPSQAQCNQCHTTAAGGSLGLEVAQLNKPHDYPSLNAPVNQLDYFEGADLLSEPLSEPQRALTLVPSRDATQPLDKRARSYLHSNCAGCHRPGGTTQSSLDFRFHIDPSFMNLCETPPRQGLHGVADGQLLAPTEPERSLLWHRLHTESDIRMPPLGSDVVDRDSAELIYQWIQRTEACTTLVGPEAGHFAIRNRDTDDYLLGRNKTAGVGATDTAEASAQWSLEPIESPFFRIANRAHSGQVLHTETPPLSLSPAPEGWWSSHWEITAEGDYFLIRNRWEEDQYLQQREGKLHTGPLDHGQAGGQWQFELIDSP